jgi:hypothetical protein
LLPCPPCSSRLANRRRPWNNRICAKGDDGAGAAAAPRVAAASG